MLAPIYLLLLLGEHGPVGPVRREFVRLASPITTTVAGSSAISPTPLRGGSRSSGSRVT